MIFAVSFANAQNETLQKAPGIFERLITEVSRYKKEMKN
jgi:hypothetical protein